MLNAECQAVNQAVKDKWGVHWDLIQEENIELSKGIGLYNDPFFGERVVQDGWKIGTSSWVLAVCKKVNLLDLDQIRQFNFQKPKLAIAQVTNLEELRKFLPLIPEFWCQPIDIEKEFPAYNWNPIPLQSVEDGVNYLTGWNY